MQLIKLQVIKCITFEEQLLHSHNFFPCNATSSNLYKVWEDRKTEWIKNASTFELKCGRYAKIGHVIKPCLLSYETVQDAESATSGNVLDKVQHNII